jgi:putative ABC transport system permease protein
MLGVVIGVITIMLVNAIGTWAQQQVEQQFKNLSVNTLFVFPMRGYEVDTETIEVIKEVNEVSKVAGFYQTNTTVSNDLYSNSFAVVGMTPEMFDVISVKLLNGEFIADTHNEAKDRVVVLGNGIFRQLYPDQQATSVVGTTLIMNKKEFTILWVLDKAWGSFGMLSIDETLYVPSLTFEKTLVRSKPPMRIAAIAKSTDMVAKAVENITNKLNEKYKVESADNAFRVIDAWGSVATAQENAAMLTMLLIGIASIVFLVSGIGIMNVMFAAVAERTKEIGILKSIGANRSSIMSQFLLESLILTWFASLLGVIIGEGIIMSNVLGSSLPMVRSNSGDLIAVVFAMATGLFFGWYPAWRASRLDPVDALRS